MQIIHLQHTAFSYVNRAKIYVVKKDVWKLKNCKTTLCKLLFIALKIV